MIGSDSKKIQVVVAKKDADLIGQLAKEENRSVSNWIYNLIKERIAKKKRGAQDGK